MEGGRLRQEETGRSPRKKRRVHAGNYLKVVSAILLTLNLMILFRRILHRQFQVIDEYQTYK
jgi:hypothetical protein